MTDQKISSFAAPADGRLTSEMLAAYERDGVIVLRDFVPIEACGKLRARTLELVDAR